MPSVPPSRSYNVIASATREGQRLMVVVLGETSGAERNTRAASLLESALGQLVGGRRGRHDFISSGCFVNRAIHPGGIAANPFFESALFSPTRSGQV